MSENAPPACTIRTTQPMQSSMSRRTSFPPRAPLLRTRNGRTRWGGVSPRRSANVSAAIGASSSSSRAVRFVVRSAGKWGRRDSVWQSCSNGCLRQQNSIARKGVSS